MYTDLGHYIYMDFWHTIDKEVLNRIENLEIEECVYKGPKAQISIERPKFSVSLSDNLATTHAYFYIKGHLKEFYKSITYFGPKSTYVPKKLRR